MKKENIENIDFNNLENDLVFKTLNPSEQKEAIEYKQYIDNITNLFKHIKENFKDKNEKFTLSNYEEYINDNIQTVFQPIVNSKDDKIKKYEALMRYNNNNNEIIPFGNSIKFLTQYCNSQNQNSIDKILTKKILDLGFKRKELENIKISLSNDLFARNIEDSKKHIDELKLYAISNKNKKIRNSDPKEIDDIKITINTGISQLFSDDMFEGMNDDTKKFIKQYIEFELLEYSIKELDQHYFDKNYWNKKKEKLKKNLEQLNKIGTRINLDDYRNIEHLLNRISVLDKIFEKNFSSIKVDAEIVKKIGVYDWLQKNGSLSDSQLEEVLKNEKENPNSIFNYYFTKETIENLDVKEFKRIKPILTAKANEGIINTMKINYLNSYELSKDNVKALDEKSNDILDKYINNNELITPDKFNKFLDNFKKERNIKEKSPEKVKNIIYEYIESKDVKNILIGLKDYFQNSKDKINFQGFYYSKPLKPEVIIENNNELRKDINVDKKRKLKDKDREKW